MLYYWACMLQLLQSEHPRARGPQREKPLQWEVHMLKLEKPLTATKTQYTQINNKLKNNKEGKSMKQESRAPEKHPGPKRSNSGRPNHLSVAPSVPRLSTCSHLLLIDNDSNPLSQAPLASHLTFSLLTTALPISFRQLESWWRIASAALCYLLTPTWGILEALVRDTCTNLLGTHTGTAWLMGSFSRPA